MENVEKLQSLEALTHKMLELARSAEWEKLPELETQRQAAMKDFFENQKHMNSGLTSEDRNYIEGVILAVQNINHQINQLAEKSKSNIISQAQQLKKRQNVNSAYMQNK